MKKILFATTALVATAGFASAEVALSGYAEMGIFGGSDIETQFWNDIDVKFTLSGETDGGLSFGATIDLDELNGDSIDAQGGGESAGFGGHGENDSSVFVSGSFGTLTMGDTDGAFDWAMAEVARGTAIADDHSSHAGFSGNGGFDGTYDGQIARYDYSFGDFSVAASAELDDTGADNAVLGLGFKYSTDLGGVALGFGLAVQHIDSDNQLIGVSVAGDMDNGINFNLNYTDATVGGTDGSHTGVGIGYSMDALLVQVNWGRFSVDGAPDVDGYGLVVNYDLGGGAVLMAGYGSGDAPSGNGGGDDTFSAGIGLSF
ncbi:MAG: porin [Paracoccaceae bacterium]